MSDTTVLELVRAGCAEAGRISEGELRRQLARRCHILADSDELLLHLRDLEREGFVSCELSITRGVL